MLVDMYGLERNYPYVRSCMHVCVSLSRTIKIIENELGCSC